MSYQGQVLYMCKDGHVRIHDVFDAIDWNEERECMDYVQSVPCDHCKNMMDMITSIDNTNGDFLCNGYIKRIEMSIDSSETNEIDHNQYKFIRYSNNKYGNFYRDSDPIEDI